jgi:hypothetical protein
MWFSIGAASGASASAANSRDSIAARMTPQQIDEVQKMALDCTAIPHKGGVTQYRIEHTRDEQPTKFRPERLRRLRGALEHP